MGMVQRRDDGGESVNDLRPPGLSPRHGDSEEAARTRVLMVVLHLEDSPVDAELTGLLIRREWPECVIRHVTTGEDYLAALHDQKFDAILSDYTLPGFDGLRALDLAKEHRPETPFLFLSGTIGEARAMEAMRRGAADYIIKDGPMRLVSALRSALRRVEGGRQPETLENRRENKK